MNNLFFVTYKINDKFDAIPGQWEESKKLKQVKVDTLETKFLKI